MNIDINFLASSRIFHRKYPRGHYIVTETGDFCLLLANIEE